MNFNKNNVGEVIKVVAVIVGAIAVIGFFIAACICYGRAGDSNLYSAERAGASLCGNIFMFCCVPANAIFALLMYGFGELISNSFTLIELGWKNGQSENVAANNTRLSDIAPINNSAPQVIEPSENEWKCPKCGAINQNYVGSCGCGEQKPH